MALKCTECAFANEKRCKKRNSARNQANENKERTESTRIEQRCLFHSRVKCPLTTLGRKKCVFKE